MGVDVVPVPLHRTITRHDELHDRARSPRHGRDHGRHRDCPQLGGRRAALRGLDCTDRCTRLLRDPGRVPGSGQRPGDGSGSRGRAARCAHAAHGDDSSAGATTCPAPTITSLPARWAWTCCPSAGRWRRHTRSAPVLTVLVWSVMAGALAGDLRVARPAVARCGRAPCPAGERRGPRRSVAVAGWRSGAPRRGSRRGHLSPQSA